MENCLVKKYGTFHQKETLIKVSSEQEILNKLMDNITIQLENDITISSKIRITNSINIDGNGFKFEMEESGTIYFENTKNVSIKNLSFFGQGSDWTNNFDLLTFDNVQNIFISQCEFRDGADEYLCFKNGSDYITVENCVFQYTKQPLTIENNKNHNFAILVGKNGTDKPISDKFHVTLYRDEFKGDIRRCPRVRNCLCQIVECTFNNKSIYTVGPENSEIVLINCVNNSICKEFIHKFGDYKIIIIQNGDIIYKNPKFSNFILPEYETL